MTKVSTNFELEHQLDKIVALAKDFNQKHRGVSFSIEYYGMGSVKFVFVNDTIKKDTTKYIEELCSKHGVNYSIVPLDGKLAVSLS